MIIQHVLITFIMTQVCFFLQDTLYALYPPQEEEDIIERRAIPETPSEHLAHRLLVKCTQLQ